MLFFPIPRVVSIPKSFGVKVSLGLQSGHILVRVTVAQIKRAFRLRLDLNQQGAVFPQRENPSILKENLLKVRCFLRSVNEVN